MPIDTSIYGNIQTPQPINPLAAYAQAMQVKGLQSNLDRADREEQQQNRLMQLVGTPDFQALPAAKKAAALQGVGAFDQAGKVITSEAAANKDSREADRAKIEGALKHMDAMGQIMAPVKDQATYDIARQQVAQLFGPESVANIPPVYDPARVNQQQQQALAVKDRLTLQQQALTAQETNRHNVATEGNQAATVAQSERNSLRVDQRARDANMNGRIPSGYRPTADGTLEFIPGGPADPNTKPAGGKPLNDTQAKALQFGTRMLEAGDTMEQLAQSPDKIDRPGWWKRSAETLPVVGEVAGRGMNWSQSAGQQQVEQAQRDFINAVLRRESGAAISPSEFDNAGKQYFPAVGDSAEVIAQKKKNREIATRGILAEVPDAEARITQVRGAKKPDGAAAPPAAPSGGVIAVTNAADYAKVPKGAQYTTPDGKVRVKQ